MRKLLDQVGYREAPECDDLQGCSCIGGRSLRIETSFTENVIPDLLSDDRKVLVLLLSKTLTFLCKLCLLRLRHRRLTLDRLPSLREGGRRCPWKLTPKVHSVQQSFDGSVSQGTLQPDYWIRFRCGRVDFARTRYPGDSVVDLQTSPWCETVNR